MNQLLRTLPLLLVSACAVSFAPPPTIADALPVTLFDSDGRRVGNVTLTADSTGLDLRFDVAGLAPGPHGVHLHSTGRCERPDFLGAGPHLDEGTHPHGLETPAGPHYGDLPNLVVGLDGRAAVTLRLTARPGSRFSIRPLFDRDGAAIIIHAGPDDQRTDPAGNSGPRIACGIVA